ncbi:diguanylate cyclase [Paenibacillus sp. ACRRX]|uniref:diguanylate cyclase domain-containing protein n=1 Tax=Paenibacillus sp. ACRRX TaxID=2918206 RepID=UPI001EF40DAB|nr:diguanylate cyclase [Paenibacillus sp. ACRRX]MCG7408161.1 diguanylate cyclase [Paenibacillus sp. ACRRX]
MSHVRDSITSLVNLTTTRKQRITALLFAIMILIVSVAIMPTANTKIFEIKSFIPMLTAWILFGDLMTSYLLYIQYRTSGSNPLLILSASFMFTGLIVIPHLLTFPNIVAEGWFVDKEQTSVWLWVVWHMGFPIGILLYTFTLGRWDSAREGRRAFWLRFAIVAGTVCVIGLIVFAVVRYESQLPLMIVHHDYSKLTRSIIGPILWAVNLLAVVYLYYRTRAKSLLHLWLMVSTFAFFLDVSLTLYAESRFSLGWYVARVNSLFSASAVLVIFFYEINRLYIRLIRSQEKLEHSEEHLNRILGSITDSFLAVDRQWKYTYMNKEAEKYVGISFEKVKGKHFWAINSHLLNTAWYTMAQLVMKNKASEEFVWYDKSKHHWLEIRIYPSNDGISIYFRDVTERMVAEGQLKEANEKLQMANRLLTDFSFTDGLTGVYNRRYFDQMLQQEWQHSMHDQIPLSLIMFDIDFFKKYNDNYGHQMGDECLTSVAHAVRDALANTTAIVCRYGGEEFAILLPQADREVAIRFAGTVRETVNNLAIPHQASKVSAFVTCSVGVATVQVPADTDSSSQQGRLIMRSDAALYEAKQSGRNQVKYMDVHLE